MSIKEHLVDVQTNIGVITYIETTRKNRPAGLKKPYEYILTKKQFDRFYAAVQAYLKPWERKLQCAGISKKAVSKGVRLDLFVLGYKPGLCGDPNEGVTRKEWQTICRELQDLFWKHLAKDANLYSEQYAAEDKFQSRLNTYVAFKELL